MTEESTIEHEGVTYHWKECIHDFAGNSSQNGFWADTWESEDGALAVTCGGDWISYFPSFEAKEKERLGPNKPFDIKRVVAVSKLVWESYSYPEALVGDSAKKMMELIGDAVRLNPAIKYLESLSTYKEPENAEELIEAHHE